jgi:hypothetical protein
MTIRLPHIISSLGCTSLFRISLETLFSRRISIFLRKISLFFHVKIEIL